MAPNEFDVWMKCHFLLFPQVAAWFAKLDQESRNAIQEAWCDILETTSFDDAQRASRAMIGPDGLEESTEFVGHNMTAARVAKMARRFRWSRAEKSEWEQAREAKPHQRQPDSHFPAGQLFRKIIAHIKEGMDSKAAGELVFDNFNRAEKERVQSARQPEQAAIEF